MHAKEETSIARLKGSMPVLWRVMEAHLRSLAAKATRTNVPASTEAKGERQEMQAREQVPPQRLAHSANGTMLR